MFISIGPDDDPSKMMFRAFEGDLKDAQAFYRRAEGLRREGYGHSLVFNVAAIALERYLVALCHLHGVEPQNHDYTCLMDAVETFMDDFPPQLNQDIRHFDTSVFGICSLDDYHLGTPQESDAVSIMSMCRQVDALFVPEEIAARRADLGMGGT